MRFTPADVARFAEWSSDHNPLHIDPAFARGTYFGRCIVHGMASVTRALDEARVDATASHFDIEFRGALAPDETYVVTSDRGGQEGSTVVSVAAGVEQVLRIRATAGGDSDLPRGLGRTVDWLDRAPRQHDQRTAPADRHLDEIDRVGELLGRYRTPPQPLTPSDAASLRTQVFALCSYLVGMELPGLRSLFTRAEVAIDPASGPLDELVYRLSVRRLDASFRVLDMHFDVAAPDGRCVAAADLRAYVRFSPVVTDLDAVAAHVAHLSALDGSVALVSGGSRGLGADIAAALALAGARVFVNYRHDSAGASALQARLAARGRAIDLLPGDAGDPAWCADALETIHRLAGPLDILVLNAASPPAPLAVGEDTLAATQQYLASNLPLIQAPLGIMLADLRSRQGTVVYVSSSYVTELPAKFGHYVALKQAGEALVTTAAREAGTVRAVILRPPPLQTAWNDTPTGALGTIAADRVAVALTRTLAGDRAGDPAATRSADVVSDFEALDRLAAPVAELPADAPTLSLAVTASFTADPLEKGVAFWGRELGVRPSLTFAPYSQVLQTLFDPSSNLSTNATGLNVVLLRVQDWLRELPAAQRDDEAFVRTHLDATTRDLVDAMRAHRGRARAATLLLLCPASVAIAATPVGPLLESAEEAVRSQLDGVPGLQVVRVADQHARYDVAPDAVDDPLRDKIGHIPYSDAYFHVLATLIVRHAWRRLVAPRKVVVVDCDNTLWRGVVGEVGAEGVTFDEGHTALHETLVALSASGVLVCLASKNEEDDVWRVFETRPEMGLRREHVVAAMVNWQRKSENLRELASRLNLGLDSFVFLDDNHVECAEVRAGCPEVLTLEWPQDAAAARRLLAHTWELDVASATSEDRQRTQMYREEFGRQALRQGTSSFRDFLDSLDLVVDVSPLGEADLARAAQLTLRTNQFNFTTIRRDESELRALLETGRHELRTVRVRDRFGDYGLVGLLIAERGSSSLITDTFLMSCRVLGRGAEHHMAAELGRIALAHGLATVHMHVEPTKRNRPAQTFLQSLGRDGSPSRPSAAEATNPLACDFDAATLADLRYEPRDAEADAPADDAPATPSTVPGDDHVVDRLRAREQQIAHTATSLATLQELVTAIDGRAASTTHASPVRDDIAELVHQAFARSLGRPVEDVVAVDQLEALGCDSFRIVEITVGLIEHFPWLPSTLLFEHRSVRAIIGHIEQMADARSRPATVNAPAVMSARHGDDRGSTDVAVVGMDLRCVGANSPDELWDMLSRGGVALRPVPVRRRFFSRPLEDGRPHWAGLLDDLDEFDAAFFGISPREADLMDPQLRLFLQVAWGALEDANAVAPAVDPDTGVFAGVMYDDYAHYANRLTRASGSPYKSWESFSLANRLSNVLGLRGPSLAIDTACSSSGTALHLACRAIANGECQAAIVGGVNVIVDPDRFAQLGRLGILSATGRCLSFGKDADGTVLGEGVGVVVLRRLDTALERGDRIYGVIKGTGLSTGSGTVGFTAPNPQAQAVAIRRALTVSGIDPATVGYVETHGTATLLGDPIEVRGLTLGYGVEEGQGPERAAIGSIKPNIGHLEAGAAVLSLIKVLLQLHRRTLLPSVSSPELNPQITFGGGPFTLQRVLEPWRANAGEPRRAAVSSFGVGGANVHVVVEEAPDTDPSVAAHTPLVPACLVTVSARSDAALRAQAARVAGALGLSGDASLPDVSYTLNATRRAFEHRATFVVRDVAGLRGALTQVAAGEAPAAGGQGSVAADAPPPRVAFLFTGQGAQFVGMGRGLYETQPAFRAALDACATEFDELLDRPLLGLLFDPEDDGDAARLDQTRYTQPTLFAVEYALGRLWQSWGVEPVAVLGHSIGEFAAMCLAGGLSLSDAARVVEARGRLMQALPSGGVMVSIAASEARVREALAGLEDHAAIAGLNSPEQTVVSGEKDAVEQVVRMMSEQGVRTRALTVSHAFHSPLMRPMVEAFRDVVKSAAFMPPAIPLVSCVTGRAESALLQDPDYWVRQILEPVRFIDGIATLHAMQATAYVEVGPQPVLVNLGRRCLGEAGAGASWLPSIKREADELETMLASAGQLFLTGQPLDWHGFEQTRGARQVDLPRYAFDTRPHWVEAPKDATASETAGPPVRVPDVATYEVRWQPSTVKTSSDTAGGTWLVMADSGDASPAATAALEARGGRCVVVSSAGTPTTEALSDALRTHAPVRGVVHLRGLDEPRSDESRSEPGADDAVAALDAWRTHAFDTAVSALQAAASQQPPVPVWCVTRQAVHLDGDAAGEAARAATVAQSTLWGLGRTAALEQPEAWGGLIDVPLAPMDERVASRIVDTLLAAGAEDQVALRADGAFVPRLVRTEGRRRRPVAVSADGTYLVTGGMGALGLQVARWLADNGARHLVLLGRSIRESEAVDGLRTRGVSVTLEAGDVSRPADVDAVLARIAASGHALRGIVHAAGVDRVAPLAELTPASAADALAAKVTGGWLLHERTRQLPLDLFVCFSSLASVLGASGRAHYAAANAFLDGLAAERRRLGQPALAINWGPWAGEGMGADLGTARQFEAIGNHLLDPADALRAMDDLMASSGSQVVVADIEWDRFGAAYQSRRRRPIVDVVANQGAKTQTDRRVAASDATSPEAIARQVREEVAQVLGFRNVDELPLDRGFFEMGLDSLSSVELVARLRQRFGVDCQGFVFETPTVADLSGRIGRDLAVRKAPASASTVAVVESPGRDADIVHYDSRLEAALVAFNEEAFQPPRRADWILPRWRWMFEASAHRLGTAPQVWVSMDGARMTAHHGAIPVDLHFDASRRRTAWLVETMVVESHRAKALGPRLLEASLRDMPFALSLGQTESMRAIQFRMGWQQVAPLETAQLLLRPERVLKGKLPAAAAFGAGLGLRAWSSIKRLGGSSAPGVSLEAVDRYGEEHDALWNRVAGDIGCAVVRDASYLNWKYVEQPGQSFVRLDAYDGARLAGTSVWMLREPDSAYKYRRAFLVDIVTSMAGDRAADLDAIVHAGCIRMAELGADAVVCLHVGPALTASLQRVGFSLRAPGRYLLVHPGTLDAVEAARLLDAGQWLVTHGDSDIDRPW